MTGATITPGSGASTNVIRVGAGHTADLTITQSTAGTDTFDASAYTGALTVNLNSVGQAADTDTLVASANAYLNALNKMIIKREKTAPENFEKGKNFKTQKMRGI